MIVEFDKKILLTAMKALSNVFSKSAMAAVAGNNCLFEVKDDGTATIEAANQGLYIRKTIKANVSQAGKIIINSNYLSGLRLNGNTVKFEYQDGDSRIKFKSGKLVGELNVSQDFTFIQNQRPNPQSLTFNTCLIPTNTLTTGLNLVGFTSSEEALQVKISLQDDQLIFMSCDPYCGSVFKQVVSKKFDKNFDIIMPLDFLKAAASLSSDLVSELGIDTTEKFFKICGSDFEIWHPVKQTTVPDINAYIKELYTQKAQATCKFKVEDANDSISTTSSIVMGSIGNDVKLLFSVTKGSNTVNCSVESTNGRANSSFDLSELIIAKDNVTVVLSSKLFLDFLNLLKDGESYLTLCSDQAVLHSFEKNTTYIMPQLQ